MQQTHKGSQPVASAASSSTSPQDWAAPWWTTAQEAKARRRLDMHLIPILFVTYGLAFLDRSNIGNGA